MTVATAGIPTHADIEGAVPPTSPEDVDRALAELTAQKDAWANLPISDRRAILREMLHDFSKVGDAWAEHVRDAEKIPADMPTAGEEWLVGPYFIIRNIRLLDRALGETEVHGQPKIPGPVKTRPDGQVTAQVFPQTTYDSLLFAGVKAEVWMEPGVTEESLPETQAVAYRVAEPRGEVSLVLGAGNVSSIGPMDALYKLFVENKVVLYKMHPLNAYLGPLIADGFRALIDWGVLRIVYGGVEVGEHACAHRHVDEIHITGSDKTVETIVFGPGDEGQERKRKRQPRNKTPISSELGNVSPAILVPGPWTDAEVAYHAENLVGMLVNNGGFNCNATRVIVTQEGWDRRPKLMQEIRRVMGETPLRHAYYPGASDRHAAFREAHPDAEMFGQPNDGELPWTLVADVDSGKEDEICFRTEAFCGVFSETALKADSTEAFIDAAVDFANDRLWGTLSATLIVHPKSLKDPAVAAAVDRAVSNLRYGTVAINHWTAMGYGLVITPWGAYPGHDIYDVQSGTGVVHNTLMFDKVQKTVVRTPFRLNPKPLWFPTHKTTLGVAQRMMRFEMKPSFLKLPGIVWDAVRS